MTTYSYASSNVRKTWLLIGVFFVFVIFLGWVFSYAFNNQAILVIFTAVSILMSFVSYWHADKIVLALTKAKEISHSENPELYHTLENLCITAGLPLPKFYFLDEAQPNAFAAGRDPQHAVVVVTRGLLEKLEKPELEGVLSHELSHIGNRDALLMTVVVVLVGIVSNISNFFLRSRFWGRRSNREEGEIGAIMMVVAILAAVLAPLAAMLLQLAISRKREFLADASGALLTRYPEGLAKALEKISQDSSPLKVASPSTAHLFIASPFRGKETTNWFVKLFSTHPPVEERIKALREMSV